jgi:hypothetical protein
VNGGKSGASVGGAFSASAGLGGAAASATAATFETRSGRRWRASATGGGSSAWQRRVAHRRYLRRLSGAGALTSGIGAAANGARGAKISGGERRAWQTPLAKPSRLRFATPSRSIGIAIKSGGETRGGAQQRRAAISNIRIVINIERK